MRRLIRGLKNNSGFTLVEVLISILILSIIAAAGTFAFVFAVQTSRDNEYDLMATNLAEERMEYVRSLQFAEVGTKTVEGGSVIYGDPKGDILQTETKKVSGINYTINTTISWEDRSGWDWDDVDWDYKSVRVEVIPQLRSDSASHTKAIETLVTRDSTQPILMEGNIGLRMIRGWTEDITKVVTVSDIKVVLNAGPDAPKQIKTSPTGIARFLNLRAGTYNVKVEPSSVGMMLHPDEAADWSTAVSAGVTSTKQFEVELPCRIRLHLRNLNGNPISLETGEKGTVSVDIPYGTDISKELSSSVLDSAGAISADYLGKLWPVGNGYPGVYTITDIKIPDSTFLGAYEMTKDGEALWSGTFSAPGTEKDIYCYFGVTPDTPSGIDTNWADYAGNIITGEEAYTAGEAKFASGNLSESLVMKYNTASVFNADGLYFENRGSATKPGLRMNNRARLTLNAGLIVFRGKIEIANAPNYADTGKIILSTVFSDGSNASSSIPGSEIGEKADPNKNYGKLYLVEPFVHNGIDLIGPGGYYFYDGQTLPDSASELIPITKENYVD